MGDSIAGVRRELKVTYFRYLPVSERPVQYLLLIQSL